MRNDPAIIACPTDRRQRFGR